MTTYLVECYWPGVDELRLGQVIHRLTDTPRGRSGDVGWLSSILIPDDEIVLCLATGGSAEVIRAAAQRAGLPAERVVSCIQFTQLRNDER
jgi:hypothetical protein